MLSTNQKGIVAETAITHACAKLGLGVSRPLNDERYDLIVDIGDRLLRVQCKYVRRHADVIVVRLYTSRRDRDGLLNRRYERGEFELFGLYCPDNDTCYALLADDFVQFRIIHLRLAQSRNNQLARISWARDYEFGATLRRLQGPIAQLGERKSGRLEAAGSSPAGSII